MLCVALAAHFFVLCAPASAQSDPSIESILHKSMAAQDRINLRGIQTEIIPRHDSGFDTITRRIVRRSDGRSLAICVDTDGRNGTVYQDDGKWTRNFDPFTRVCSITRSVSRIADGRSAERVVRRILSNYRVRLIGTEMFSGRSCYILALDPKDPFSHPLDVRIDVATGATISRTEYQRRGGSTISLNFFTSISFPRQIADSELASKFPPGTRKIQTSLSLPFRSVEPLRRKVGFEICLPNSMPAGFQFESCEIVRLNDTPTACLRFSDGLAAINIFESRTAEGFTLTPGIIAKTLPRGEAIAMCQVGRTSCAVMGPRLMEGVVMIAKALDTDSARNKMESLSRTFGVPIASVIDLRNQGLGLDHIAALLEIRAQTGRTMKTLMVMHQDGWGWDLIAQRLRVDVHRISDKIRPYQSR